MGKTRNLRRSKKVVKTKRTRSRVSKKNGKKTHKKRYRSRKKRGGLKKTHSAQVYARLKENNFFKPDDDDYNNRLLTEVSKDKTVINATDPDSAIIDAANKIANEKANEKANENASSQITNFPNKPHDPTINGQSTDTNLL
jgi:hypothetical protein